MYPLHCKISYFADSIHLEQLFTGFEGLRKQKLLTLEYHRHQHEQYSKGNGLAVMQVQVNDKFNIIYDTQDSQQISTDTVLTGSVDFYFKRSLPPNTVSNCTPPFKLYPLGFNYPVFSNKAFSLQRMWYAGSAEKRAAFWLKNSKILSNFFSINNSAFNAQQQKLEEIPRWYEQANILLMTRAWPEQRARTEEKKEQRFEMNQMRAACIRMLKKEFGNNFYGGFSTDEYSQTHFPDCVLPDNRITRKKNYLQLVKTFPICVATTGLENSTGWRMGEYIALSKAILSEKLHNEVPGDFAAGKNYLEFYTADHCVEQAHRLFQDAPLRYEMMHQNFRYYHAYLRPDMLVWNALRTVLLDSGKL